MEFSIDEQTIQLIELIGAGCAIAGAIITLLTRYLKKKKNDDPFIKYYAVSSLVLMIATALAMRFANGQNQILAVQTVFGLSVFFAAAAVVWRFFDVRNYKKEPSVYDRPIGFDHKRNYLPYALLFAFILIFQTIVIFLYTSPKENEANRTEILISFAILCCLITICRMAWHIIDQSVYIVINKQQKKHNEQI